MNNKLPYQGMADQVASRGRYGDTTLMHVNPAEVQGLASLTQLTINPDTGYPEAFLPLLAPFLGTLAGTALGGAAGATGLGLTAAGAAGSGLATGLATGSVEQGLMAGLTGFGLGSALQGANLGGAEQLGGGAEALGGGANASLDAITSGTALSPIPTPTIPTPNVGANPMAGLADFGIPSSTLNSVDNFATNAVGGIKSIGSQGSTLADLGQKGGLKKFGAEALKMKNLIPTATGLGGIAVEQDIEKSNANIQGMKDRKEREAKEALANYVENRPGMTQAPFNAQYSPGMQPQ